MIVCRLLLYLLPLLSPEPPRSLAARVHPPAPLQGQLVVIDLLGARPGDRVSGTFDQRRVRFFVDERGRVRGLAAVPLEREPGEAPLVVTVQPPQADPIFLGVAVQIEPGKFEESELTVKPRYVRPEPEARARIRAEREAMSRLWRLPPGARRWSGSFAWPVQSEITSPFGVRRTFDRVLQSRHQGLDLDGRTGDPVRAIGAGRVVMTAWRYYAGGTVVVDHGLRLFSLYFHLSGFEVQEGDPVEQGQLIGRVGRSGRVTGPHLHLSIKLEGIYLDPQSLLEFDFEAAKESR